MTPFLMEVGKAIFSSSHQCLLCSRWSLRSTQSLVVSAGLLQQLTELSDRPGLGHCSISRSNRTKQNMRVLGQAKTESELNDLKVFQQRGTHCSPQGSAERLYNHSDTSLPGSETNNTTWREKSVISVSFTQGFYFGLSFVKSKMTRWNCYVLFVHIILERWLSLFSTTK